MSRRGIPNGKCQICRHPERHRIDWLLASGTNVRAVARKFGIQYDALYRHQRIGHISDAFKKSVRIGPFQSEESLRKLAAENGTSVLQNLKVIYGGLAQRWLVNYEAGADGMLVQLTDKMVSVLEKQARLSGELVQAPSSVTNIFVSPQFLMLQSQLIRVLASHPEARRAVIEAFRELERSAPAQIEAANASHTAETALDSDHRSCRGSDVRPTGCCP